MRAHQLLGPEGAGDPSRTAIHWVDRDRSLTYAEARDAMQRAAATLSSFGVGAGGRVGLFAHPGLDYVVALLGAWRLGASAVMVDLAAKERYGELMAAGAPDAIVYTNDHFDYVGPAMATLPTVRVHAGMDGPQKGTVGWLETLATADVEAVPVDETGDGAGEDVAIVTFGPDGEPAPVTHRELLAAASSLADRLGMEPSDVTMCPTPLADRFHLEASILPALARGATAAMLKTWEAEPGWDAMDRHGTTVLCGDAGHCRDLLAVSGARGRAPASLRIAVALPSPEARDLVPRFRSELGLELIVAG